MCLYWLCYSFKSKKFWFINLVILSSKLCQDYILDDKSILILWKDSTLFLYLYALWRGYRRGYVVIRFIMILSYTEDIYFQQLFPWISVLKYRNMICLSTCLCCAICTDSSSNASQRELTLMSWTASYASFCTWKRSLTRRATGKLIRAVCSIFGVISSVISLNWKRLNLESFIRIDVTVFTSVSFKMVIIFPAAIFSSLFINMVYNSSRERYISSIPMYAPMFFSNSTHSSACGSWFHFKYPLRWLRYCLSRSSPSIPNRVPKGLQLTGSVSI